LRHFSSCLTPVRFRWLAPRDRRTRVLGLTLADARRCRAVSCPLQVHPWLHGLAAASSLPAAFFFRMPCRWARTPTRPLWGCVWPLGHRLAAVLGALPGLSVIAVGSSRGLAARRRWPCPSPLSPVVGSGCHSFHEALWPDLGALDRRRAPFSCPLPWGQSDFLHGASFVGRPFYLAHRASWPALRMWVSRLGVWFCPGAVFPAQRPSARRGGVCVGALGGSPEHPVPLPLARSRLVHATRRRGSASCGRLLARSDPLNDFDLRSHLSLLTFSRSGPDAGLLVPVFVAVGRRRIRPGPRR